MAKLAREYPDFEFVQQVVAQIPWTHNILILDKEQSFDKRKWYINETLKNGWSKSILKSQLDTKLYERQVLSDKSTNFNNTLPEPQSDLAIQTIKDPYIFDFITLKGKVLEKDVENAMIEKVKDLLLELGKGFAYVGNQYKIIIDDKDYFLDLLFYHLDLKCYIVVELKAREFLPEDAGKLNFYLSAVDKLLKKDSDNNSIGLILCKEKKKFTVECALKDINKPIGVSEYKILEQIPEFLNSKLPEIEDIELHMNNIDT